MDQKVQINFTPLLAAAFAYEIKTYKVIDELCEKYKINVEKEISNNEWKDFIAAKEGEYRE